MTKWKHCVQYLKYLGVTALHSRIETAASSSVACCTYLRCFSTSCVQANPELTAIWAVGQRIWQRDFPGIYTSIAAFQWSENILPVMEALRGNNNNSHV